MTCGADSKRTLGLWGRRRMSQKPARGTLEGWRTHGGGGGGPGAQAHTCERGAAWTCRGHEGQGPHGRVKARGQQLSQARGPPGSEGLPGAQRASSRRPGEGKPLAKTEGSARGKVSAWWPEARGTGGRSLRSRRPRRRETLDQHSLVPSSFPSPSVPPALQAPR